MKSIGMIIKFALALTVSSTIASPVFADPHRKSAFNWSDKKFAKKATVTKLDGKTIISTRNGYKKREGIIPVFNLEDMWLEMEISSPYDRKIMVYYRYSQFAGSPSLQSAALTLDQQVISNTAVLKDSKLYACVAGQRKNSVLVQKGGCRYGASFVFELDLKTATDIVEQYKTNGVKKSLRMVVKANGLTLEADVINAEISGILSAAAKVN